MDLATQADIAQQWDWHFARQNSDRVRAIADAAETADWRDIATERARRVEAVHREGAERFAKLRAWTASVTKAILEGLRQQFGASVVARSLRTLAERRAVDEVPAPARRPDPPPLIAALLDSFAIAPRAPSARLTS